MHPHFHWASNKRTWSIEHEIKFKGPGSRFNTLTITAEGRKVLRAIDSAADRAQELILTPLKPSERPVFIEMLERLVKLNNSRSRVPLGPAATCRRK
jgi:hypothetical protein